MTKENCTMKFSIFCCLILLAAAGCVTNPSEQRSLAQQQQEDYLIFQEDMRRMRARLDAMEQEMNRLIQQVNAATVDQSRTVQSQLQGLNASMDELQRRIRAVDAAREADKKEIVETLSKRVSSVLATQPSRSSAPAASAPRRQVSSEGYEHVVEPGETLSAIAKAYGVRTDDIIQANNMKSADVLRVGQKIFVPAR
jgi:LysM repeat protein